jgi:hypothetical protein
MRLPLASVGFLMRASKMPYVNDASFSVVSFADLKS